MPADRRSGKDEMEPHIRRAYEQVGYQEASSRRVVIVPVVRRLWLDGRGVAVQTAARLVGVVLVQVVEGVRDVTRMGSGRDERNGRARHRQQSRPYEGDLQRKPQLAQRHVRRPPPPSSQLPIDSVGADGESARAKSTEDDEHEARK